MRVLFGSRNFFPTGVVGGGMVSVLYLAKELQRRGHEVAVLSVDDHAHTGIHAATGIQEFRINLRNVYTRHGKNLPEKVVWHTFDRFVPLMYKDYVDVISTFKPDVVHTNVMAGLGASVWKAAQSLKLPIVHTVHDYYILCISSGMRRKNTNCSTPCLNCVVGTTRTRAIARLAVDEVVYVSEHMRKAHERHGIFSDRTGSSVIIGAYEPAVAPRERARLVTPGLLTIGFFGRISPEKGIGELIDALAQLPAEQWSLRVGGGGESSFIAMLREKTRSLPVEFVGVQRPDDFYPTVDAVVISSLWNEPAARVTYEAGIWGAVPIVSARGGLPELVDFGKRGWVFEPKDKEQLGAILKRIIDDPALLDPPRQHWKEAAASFSGASIADATLEVYERAIAKHHRS